MWVHELIPFRSARMNIADTDHVIRECQEFEGSIIGKCGDYLLDNKRRRVKVLRPLPAAKEEEFHAKEKIAYCFNFMLVAAVGEKKKPLG